MLVQEFVYQSEKNLKQMKRHSEKTDTTKSITDEVIEIVKKLQK